MPAQVTTRAQVNGYRFLVRRLEHALIRADSRMIHDPMRGQTRALVVGAILAVLICGSAAVMAFMKPVPNMGDAPILISKSDGTLYVRLGDKLHPTLNLASARLAVGSSSAPKSVDNKFLNGVGRGPLLGIIGAPSKIDHSDDLNTSSWTVCDADQASGPDGAGGSTVTTTVLANEPTLGPDIRAISGRDMALVSAGSRTFLIYNGVRAAIDTTDPVLMAAMRLGNIKIRAVSPGLLNAIPMTESIRPIEVPGLGTIATYLEQPYPIGSILRSVDSRGEQLYVVLPDGLQAISTLAADIIRYGNPRMVAQSSPTDIPPAMLSSAPIVRTLMVDHYPEGSPQFIEPEADSVLCLAWQRNAWSTQASTRILVGNKLPLSGEVQPVTLASADGSGPGLDSVFLKPGTGEYVESTGVEADSKAPGQEFYVSDLGLRYHIDSPEAADALGAVGVKDPSDGSESPQFAPWQILSLLPPGPELSQQAALISHDGVPADAQGRPVAIPRS